MHLNLFIHSPVDGHIGSSQVLNTTNNAAINFLVHGSLCTWTMGGVGLLGWNICAS